MLIFYFLPLDNLLHVQTMLKICARALNIDYTNTRVHFNIGTRRRAKLFLYCLKCSCLGLEKSVP